MVDGLAGMTIGGVTAETGRLIDAGEIPRAAALIDRLLIAQDRLADEFGDGFEDDPTGGEHRQRHLEILSGVFALPSHEVDADARRRMEAVA